MIKKNSLNKRGITLILAFESVSEIRECDCQMKATEQCFPNVPSITEVIIIFESLGKVIMRFSKKTVAEPSKSTSM